MNVEIRNDSVFIHGYVNAVERLSKPIRETLHGKVRTFLERIRAGVFRDALKRNDEVLVLLNHDNNRVLATTKDTAVLEEDNIGLRAEITITDPEVVQKARDGKLTGWSFGFIANDDELTTEGSSEIRTVTSLELREVSILDDTKSPAYYGTLIETREGGAEVMHIRVEAFEEEQTEGQTVSLDELAALVAQKVIEALKAEEKAEPEVEPEEQEEEQQEEQQEESQEADPEEEENRAVAEFEERLSKLK